ncbi:MAG: queuosine precursor transporter [Planctomycetes bacterium]|nr:queuosine precursor transporter [Planctomycetota bacterium]
MNDASIPRRQTLLLALCAVFVGFYVVANLIGAKLWPFTIFGLMPQHLGLSDQAGPFVATTGILAFPLTFILTDIINEYYGQRVVRTFTILAIAVSLLLQPVIQAAIAVQAVSFSPEYTGEEMRRGFEIAFGQSWAILAGSLTAFALGQLLDIKVFQILRRKTGGKLLWLRAQISTLISQVIDSFVVIFLAFVIIPWALPFLVGTNDKPWPISAAANVSVTNYAVKFLIAIAITPALYLVHYLIKAWLGKAEAEALVLEAHPSDPA